MVCLLFDFLYIQLFKHLCYTVRPSFFPRKARAFLEKPTAKEREKSFSKREKAFSVSLKRNESLKIVSVTKYFFLAFVSGFV